MSPPFPSSSNLTSSHDPEIKEIEGGHEEFSRKLLYLWLPRAPEKRVFEKLTEKKTKKEPEEAKKREMEKVILLSQIAKAVELEVEGVMGDDTTGHIKKHINAP